MLENPPLPVTPDTIAAARGRIAGLAVRTPLVGSPVLDALTGGRVLLKAENLQRTGSFKFRGAMNVVASLREGVRTRGIACFSSGNHGQAIAAVARHFGVPALVVMPADAPAFKLAATRAHGAEIFTYDRLTQDREKIGRDLAADRGMTLIPPFEHPDVVAGQGTVGAEMAEDAAALGLTLHTVLVCASGGGLVAGVGTAVRAAFAACQVWSVEPAGHDDLARSLAAGHIVSNPPGVRSICDALLVPRPGAYTFSINHGLLAGGLAVTDAEVMAAMAFAATELKLVLEPGGAVALAEVLARPDRFAGRTVGVVLSGGNVDPALLARALGT